MTFPTQNLFVGRAQLRPILWLCSPTVLGFIVFLFSFPLYRPVPFSRLTVFDALFLWSFVAPIFTITAIAKMSKRRFRKAASTRLKVGVWLAVLLVFCLNLFLITGFLAAAYY